MLPPVIYGQVPTRNFDIKRYIKVRGLIVFLSVP
jgi:hypothetical protein